MKLTARALSLLAAAALLWLARYRRSRAVRVRSSGHALLDVPPQFAGSLTGGNLSTAGSSSYLWT